MRVKIQYVRPNKSWLYDASICLNENNHGQRYQSAKIKKALHCRIAPGVCWPLEGGRCRATDSILTLIVHRLCGSMIKPREPVLYYLQDRRGFVRKGLQGVSPNTELPPTHSLKISSTTRMVSLCPGARVLARRPSGLQNVRSSYYGGRPRSGRIKSDFFCIFLHAFGFLRTCHRHFYNTIHL